MNWNESFQCPTCGPSPPTIVCDGTMISSEKTFFLNFPTPHFLLHKLLSVDTQRKSPGIFCKSSLTLVKYAGYTKDRKCVRQCNELTRAEFRELCNLTSSNFPSLSTVLNKLNIDTGKKKSFGSSLPKTALPVEFFKFAVSRGSLM